MFTGFSERTIDFMWGLRLNNNKVWFDEHKDEFQREFNGPIKELAQDVFDRLSKDYDDKGFVHKVSRIYKDARRVRGGDPYRSNLWFCIERPSAEWTSTPVFWFDIFAENWSYGLGYYMARAGTMAKFRARLEKDAPAFEKLASRLNNQKEFVLDGPEYARKKPAPTEGTAPWFNRKSISLTHEEPWSEALYSPELAGRLTEGYRFLMPFYDYFVNLDSDPAPAPAP